MTGRPSRTRAACSPAPGANVSEAPPARRSSPNGGSKSSFHGGTDDVRLIELGPSRGRRLAQLRRAQARSRQGGVELEGDVVEVRWR
jgi:hypothetical protein